MTQPKTDLRFSMAMQRGDVREAMGWSFVARLEKLVDELLGKIDCPSKFWVIYSAKWDEVNRRIKEVWQVTDERPKVHMLGQAIYEIDKSGKAQCWALPLDIPVPESELSDELVMDNYEASKVMPLSDQVFEKIN